MPMTAPGSVAGITPLAQLAPDAPSPVMDALQQVRAVLAPYERPVEAPVVPADPRDRMQDAINAVDATVTNRTQLRTLPTALLALSDKSKDERRALIQTPLYQRAPEEAQKDALRDYRVRLAEAARKHGKAVSMAIDSVEGVREMIALGATIVNYSSDTAVLRSGYARAIEEIRRPAAAHTR